MLEYWTVYSRTRSLKGRAVIKLTGLNAKITQMNHNIETTNQIRRQLIAETPNGEFVRLLPQRLDALIYCFLQRSVNRMAACRQSVTQTSRALR